MDPIILISVLAALVIILLVVGAPMKPVRFLGNIAVKFVIGALMLFFVNTFGSFIDFHIPNRAPLLPKLRGHFAEFLNESSPERLRILFSPTCVGLRYGHLSPR